MELAGWLMRACVRKLYGTPQLSYFLFVSRARDDKVGLNHYGIVYGVEQIKHEVLRE
jgi:hypothetical protein